MIQINQENTFNYFEESVIDGIFNSLQEIINKNILNQSNLAGGCEVFEDIPIKKLGNKKVFVAYYYEVLGQKTTKGPIPINLNPYEVIIFDGMPQEIIDKINKIRTMVENNAKNN